MNKEKRMAKVQAIMDSIIAMQTQPGNRPLTNGEMKTREDGRHYMAGALRINGLAVKDEYQ